MTKFLKVSWQNTVKSSSHHIQKTLIMPGNTPELQMDEWIGLCYSCDDVRTEAGQGLKDEVMS